MAAVHDVVLVVEDQLSLDIAGRLLALNGGFRITRNVIEKGCGNIRRSIPKYKNASLVIPHIVLTDLDRVACPVKLRNDWNAINLPPSMLFRVVVREVESWLLGDKAGFSAFAGIPASKVPDKPEQLSDPKQVLINLVRRSRNRRLASEIVPLQGSAASIGPLYNARLGEFARKHWNVNEAVQCCPSLERMKTRLTDFLRL